MPAQPSRASPARAPAPAPWPGRRSFRCIERALRRIVAALVGALIAGEACAEFSGTATLLSDYRYRGISLSSGHPAAQVGLAYDDPSGAYAGFFASSVQFAISPHRELQAVPYVGYARRFASGVSAEVGAEYAAFTGPGDYDYAEFYVGVSSEPFSARLYYAPRYFGREPGSFYAELNGAQPVSDRVRLFAHVGLLVNRGDYLLYGPSDRRVLDGRVGLAIDIESFTLQASWVGVNSAYTGYPVNHGRKNTAVVSVTWAF